VTAANVASGANLANAATDVNTANTIVRRDASGNFTAGNITGNLLGNATTATSAITATTSTNFTGTLAGDVTGTQGATVVSTVGGSTAVNVNAATILANAATSANTANAIVRRDASGNFDAGLITGDLSGNATTATTSTNFSGALAGDVTGTQAATVVSQVGGVTAANVASGANLANAATAANTAGTIVRRDASGNFTAGTITGTLSGNATNVSGIVAVPNGGTGASSLTDHGVLLGSGTNPVSVTGTGSAGQVLQSGGAGADPGYSNAAYPGAAGDPGSIIVSDGTNFTSAGLSTSADYLGANVTMTNAGPFYTGPSVSLPAGTWYISGTLTVRNPGGSSGALVSRLQYGGTSLSSSETYIRAGYQVSITLSGIVTFTATTTISTQAASNLAGCIIRASAFTFPTGNNASFIHAVRIGP
jgi:HAMP domain-containing protein